MTAEKKRLVIGISGGSGFILAVRLLEFIRHVDDWETHLVCSDGARLTLASETDLSFEQVAAMATASHAFSDVGASIASGSFRTEGMVVVPCSMKTLAGVATGYADNLLLRAADVTLKERRRLVLVTREAPLHLGHLNNMTTATAMGAIILPPVLTYYIKPKTLEDVENHIVAKALHIFGIDAPMQRWKGMPGHD